MSEVREDRPRRLYELIAEKRVVKGRDSIEDELEELERLEMRELLREAKRLRLQELVEKQRRKLREMGVGEGERVNPNGGAGSSLVVDVEVARYLSSLPDEQRQRVLRDLQFLKAVERLPPQAAIGLMYMYTLASQQGNPHGSQQASFKDLAEAVKILTDAAVRPSTPPEAQGAVINILNNLVGIVTSLSRELTEERLKRIEERASYNPVDMVKSILDIAKEVKKLGGAEAANPDTLIKLKELEAKTNLMLQRMQMEQQRWMQQQQLEMKKWENLSQIFQGPVGKTLETLGGATAARIRGSSETPPSQQSQQQAVETPYGRMLRVACPKCRGALWVLESQDIVACPHCGTVLKKQVQQPQQQQEVKQGGVGSSVGAEGGSAGKSTQQAEQKPA